MKEEHKFTDDTAMARSVARSLIEKKRLDVKDMAQRLVSKGKVSFWRTLPGGGAILVFTVLCSSLSQI